MNTKRLWILAMSLSLVASSSLLGNGGAWQTGVPATGNAAATDQKKMTNVTIEEENLTIDLHQEFAAVEVRYRMKNAGAQVDQDFFFPVERWSESEDEAGNTLTDLEGYAISADGAELKLETVDAKGAQPKAEKDAHGWGDFKPGVRLWKKSSIPFAQGQTREIVIRYRSPYAANRSSVSDDSHSEELYFRYSLSPAATWKGPIEKGKITINYLHPRPEEISITKPKDRFKKVSDTQFVWEFQNLKPTLADDMKIVVHPAYDAYPARGEFATSSEGENFRSEYVVEKNHYFVQHADYDAVASSTRNPDPAPSPTPTVTASPSESPSDVSTTEEADRTYDVNHIKSLNWGKPWAEGVEGDGVGESITLTVYHPLPLDAIMIMPGFKSEDKTLWAKNNRVAELEITLNNEHTFTATIPDEPFNDLYPIPVRDYTKPVNTVKLVIKKVHAGTDGHDTCIGQVQLRGKLSQKPKIQGAR
ncbi:MAG: NADase-type glycan-binding domain-containing protein [Chthoniobacterales bacterium]